MSRQLIRLWSTPGFSAVLELKWADLWVGVYVAKPHAWICLLPCLPLHLRWGGEREP